MKRLICIIFLALLLYAPAMAEEATLNYCWFSFGGYLPPQTYEITLEDGVYQLQRDDGKSCQLEEDTNLLSIIDNYDLYAWDGFNESEQYVLDGEGFSLDILFSDGRHIHAHGDNRFPEGYDAVKNEMVKLFDAILDGDFSGTYIYTAGGLGGDFTITLEADGTYTFYEGPLSSYIGGGHWYAERSYIYLVEENGFDLQFYFTGEKDTLIYEGRYSDSFPYVKVPDGGRFVKAGFSANEITDFYYTYSTSTNPPFFQRYRFYREGNTHHFYHETREGGGWPQTEEDITASGKIELSAEEWAAFFSYLQGGTIREPEVNDEDGDDGPWMYVYRGNGQEEYLFPSYGARLAFEEYCEQLRGLTGMKIRVTDGEHTVIYQLNDSPSAKSLYAMLPIDVAVENYGRNEKIFCPEKTIDTADGIEGGGEAGGLALFSPWGNVVMYYDSFSSYPGLYILGEAVEGVEQVEALSGTLHVEALQ